jgi:hypothetical protein
VKNFDGLAAQSGEGERGKRRGDWGLFIGTARYRNGQELKELKRGRNYWEETVSGEFNGGRLKNLTGGSRSSEGEKGLGIPFQDFARWATGSFLCWAE